MTNGNLLFFFNMYLYIQYFVIFILQKYKKVSSWLYLLYFYLFFNCLKYRFSFKSKKKKSFTKFVLLFYFMYNLKKNALYIVLKIISLSFSLKCYFIYLQFCLKKNKLQIQIFYRVPYSLFVYFSIIFQLIFYYYLFVFFFFDKFIIILRQFNLFSFI